MLQLLIPLLLATTGAGAHEYWLEREDVGGATDIVAHVGEGLRAEEQKRFHRDRVHRLEIVGPEGSRDLLPEATEDAGWFARFRTETQGAVVVLETEPTILEMESRKFNRYLRAEGLDAIRTLRAQRADSGKDVTERYRRCAKVVLSEHLGWGATITRPVGLPFELVPDVGLPPVRFRGHDPHLQPVDFADEPALRAHGKFNVRALYNGKPARGVLVKLFRRADDNLGDKPIQTQRTDDKGAAAFRIPDYGLYMVSAVQMVPAPGGGADWESYWATVTFGDAGFKKLELPELPDSQMPN